MQSKFISEKITYTGAELRSGWIKEKTGLEGEAIVSFIGPANVREHMVDLEDIAKGDYIYSQEMLHFLVEHSDKDLEKTVGKQRLLISIIQELLNKELKGYKVKRVGDDLYDGDKKLSVSIATASPVSTLIHAGVNIKSEGAPVKARGLSDYKIEPKKFADKVIRSYVEEVAGIKKAVGKVKKVH